MGYYGIQVSLFSTSETISPRPEAMDILQIVEVQVCEA